MPKIERRAYQQAYRTTNREKIKAQSAEYYAVNREKIKAAAAVYRAANREKINARGAEYYASPENRAVALVSGARTRARNKSLPFNLDNHIEEIRERLTAGVCELSGVSFTWKAGGPYSPSFDRKIPKLGYTYSNIRIICWCLNSAFGYWGEEATIPIMKAFLKTQSRILEDEGSDAA